MARWKKCGIEVPPGWERVVAERAEQLGCPMRYLWVAAAASMMELPIEELRRLALGYELVARKDAETLAGTVPGRCEPLINTWTAKLAASFRDVISERSIPRRSG